MIIYRGFLRKKNVKIYITIFTLLFFLILILSSGRKHYIELNNENYNNSIISVTSDKDIAKKLKYFGNIKEIETGILLEIDGESIFFVTDKSLKDNEIIVADSLGVKDQMLISINDHIETFDVNGYHRKREDEFYISFKKYQDLKKDNDLITYRLDLKDWSNYSKTVDKLIEADLDVSFQINNMSDLHFDNQIRYFSIVTIVLIIILEIILTISIFNLIEDEKKVCKLYRYLGFKKRKVKYILIQKLILIFTISLIISVALQNIILIFI